jgi:protease II
MELQVQKRENEAFLAGLGKKKETLENDIEKIQEKKEKIIRRIRNRRTTSKTVRLPHQHRQSATKQESYMVVGRRVFPMNAEHVIRNPLSSSGTLYVPRAKMGYPVSKDGKNSREFILDISKHSPKRSFISFWVRCDNKSFISFQELRAVAVKKGFEYSVAPYPAQPGLVLSRGRPPVE